MQIDIDETEGFDPRQMERPVLVWDGDCAFCKRSVLHIAGKLGAQVRYVTYQSVHDRFEHLSAQEFAQAVYFIEPDGSVYRGAEAVFRAYSWRPKGSLLLRMYHDLPGFSALSEWGYRRVAHNRGVAGRVAKWLPGW